MTEPNRLYLLAADTMLLIHFAFVAFVVVGLIVIWVGHFCHWPFVGNFYFRLAHLLAMGLVLMESLGGMVCPLTTWENELRLLAGGGETYAGSFMQHWLHRLLFFDVSEEMFKLAYGGFFAVVALTLRLVPPKMPRRKARKLPAGN
jgi:hypothetical protein